VQRSYGHSESFDAILNAVVVELQRNPDAKVKITLEIEAETSSGFSEADIGVVRDNARQLKFKAGVDGVRMICGTLQVVFTISDPTMQ
jgi:hypothetical protein